jgi:hypothetical protein
MNLFPLSLREVEIYRVLSKPALSRSYRMEYDWDVPGEGHVYTSTVHATVYLS